MDSKKTDYNLNTNKHLKLLIVYLIKMIIKN